MTCGPCILFFPSCQLVRVHFIALHIPLYTVASSSLRSAIASIVISPNRLDFLADLYRSETGSVGLSSSCDLPVAVCTTYTVAALALRNGLCARLITYKKSLRFSALIQQASPFLSFPLFKSSYTARSVRVRLFPTPTLHCRKPFVFAGILWRTVDRRPLYV